MDNKKNDAYFLTKIRQDLAFIVKNMRLTIRDSQ